MRDLISLVNPLFETPSSYPNPSELEAFKSVIASKIKTLPADDATAKTLKEIEELLQHVHAGGRMGMIKGQLHAINDPAVMAAQKRLAQYIASMEVSTEDRAELFKLWKADKLVKVDVLLSKKNVTFADVFAEYGKNAAITELVDDVMSEAALGQGKGEFGLNVLSKSVAKPGGLGDFQDNIESEEDIPEDKKGKGDLIIHQGGKWRKIECKTTHGGAARFSDQEVRPAPGYEAAAAALEKFVTKLKGTTAYDTTFPRGFAKGYGINLRSAIAFNNNFLKHGEFSEPYLQLVENVITLIFGGPSADKKAVKKIMDAFRAGDSNATMQAWAQASFSYYISKKDDEGVLATNLNTKSFVFYSNADDLAKQNLRLDADTVYLTAQDVARGAYPQMTVVPTTFGANARAAAEKKAREQEKKAAKENPLTAPELNQYPTTQAQRTEVEDQAFAFAQNYAARKGIFDEETINQIAFYAIDQIEAGVPPVKIEQMMPKLIPALQKQPAQPAAQPAPVQPESRILSTQGMIRERRWR